MSHFIDPSSIESPSSVLATSQVVMEALQVTSSGPASCPSLDRLEFGGVPKIK